MQSRQGTRETISLSLQSCPTLIVKVHRWRAAADCSRHKQQWREMGNALRSKIPSYKSQSQTIKHYLCTRRITLTFLHPLISVPAIKQPHRIASANIVTHDVTLLFHMHWLHFLMHHNLQQAQCNATHTVVLLNKLFLWWRKQTYNWNSTEFTTFKQLLYNHSEMLRTSFSNSATWCSSISIFFSYWRILFCMRSSSSLSQHCLASVWGSLYAVDDYTNIHSTLHTTAPSIHCHYQAHKPSRNKAYILLSK